MKKENKKNINLYVILFLIILILITTTIIISYSKYVFSEKSEHALNSEKIYFESNLLSVDGKQNKYYDWDLTSEYSIKFKILNYSDHLKINESNIKYKVEIPTNELNAEIYINGIKKIENVLEGNELNEDEIEIKINPSGKILSKLEMEVKAILEEPYEKEISGTFIIGHGELGESYVTNLINNPGKDYSLLELKTNSYMGNLRIEYDKTKVVPNVNTNLLEDVEKHDGYIILNVKANSNYEIKFIKKNERVNLTLGSDIKVL